VVAERARRESTVLSGKTAQSPVGSD